jgi:hypothetical protein
LSSHSDSISNQVFMHLGRTGGAPTPAGGGDEGGVEDATGGVTSETGHTVVLTAMTDVTTITEASLAGQLVTALAQLVIVDVAVVKMVLVVIGTYGVPVGVGVSLGPSDGVCLGVSLGVSDGFSLGVSDGFSLGVSDGFSLGVSEGFSLGVS